MKVILFGTGEYFKTFMKVYDSTKVEIIAISDNNKSLHGKSLVGIEICEPQKIVELEADYVVITSGYFETIKKQLLQLGILEEKIVSFVKFYRRLSTYDYNDVVVDFLKDDILMSMITQRKYDYEFQRIKNIQEKNLFLNAKQLIDQMSDRKIDSLEEIEFQVFSQFGEDGIIQWLIHNVELEEKTFVEFGVEDYTEANTRFLLMNNNWSGLVIDGSEENINHVKNWEFFWRYDLTAVAKFITKDNINSIISDAGFSGDIGLLSVDIDGNDYWVLNAIECIKPRIVICEYNGVFGPDKKVTVPYDEEFFRTDKHYSNLYWGVSIGALCDWAEKNNYYYVGSNSAGNNAFFVRKDCINEERLPKKRNLFVSSKYRESINSYGKLTYLRGEERLKCIKDMPLVDISNNSSKLIADIYHL